MVKEIEYMGRIIDVVYDEEPYEAPTYLTPGNHRWLHVEAIIYEGRDILRLINRWAVEDIINEY